MRKLIFFILVLGVALFLTNPGREQYYKQVLADEAGIGSETFTTLKFSAVELMYAYENYYVVGVLRRKADRRVTHVGLFTKVVALPNTEPYEPNR